MAYNKYSWANGEVLNADKINHIENGIYDNAVTQATMTNGVASFKNAAGAELFTLNIPVTWTHIKTETVQVSTTATTAFAVATIACGEAVLDSSKVIYVRVRDNAGKRQGYFLGSDAFFINSMVANGSTTQFNFPAIVEFKYLSDGTYSPYAAQYGVYGYSITSTGNVIIRARYSATYTLTIDGTFTVDIYSLNYPDGKSIFDWTGA